MLKKGVDLEGLHVAVPLRVCLPINNSSGITKQCVAEAIPGILVKGVDLEGLHVAVPIRVCLPINNSSGITR